MSPEPPLDAMGIARRQFATVRRGYDPAEVRAYLAELSDAVARIQRHEADEHERAERAESRAHLEQLDEHRLVELLGEETARVLEAAREASAGIRSKAEESAARMVRQAQAEARATAEAAERAAAARRTDILAEAEALRRQADEEVERRRAEGQLVAADLRRAAEVERDEMLAAAARVRADAEAAAEQTRASAREEGRRLVGEAQVARERILADLARRRRLAREQLERLNGARQRLLAAYEVVRRTVDEATNELVVSLPEARTASEAAVRRVRHEPDETVDVIEAELSVARMSGTPEESAGDELDVMIRELADEEPAPDGAVRGAGPGDTASLPDARSAEDGGTLPPPAPAPAPALPQAQPGRPRSLPGRGGGEAAGGTTSAPAPAAGTVAARSVPAAPPDGGGPHAGAAPPVATGGGREVAPASAPGPAGEDQPVAAPAPVTSLAPPDTGQSDAERWGVRLPRSSRRRSAASRRTPAEEAASVAGTPDVPGAGGTAPAGPPEAETASSAGATTADPAMADAPGDESATGPSVDELFARIRAARGPEGPAPARPGTEGVAVLPDTDRSPGSGADRSVGPGADRSVGSGADLDGPPGAGPGARSGPAGGAGADETGDGGDEAAPADPVAAALAAREAALTPVERGMGRRLKRVLADEQNQVLDALRRGGTVGFADVLPAGDEHVDRYARAARSDLEAAARHGADMAGGATTARCDELAAELGRTVVEPLRRRIQRSFDDADGDVEEVVERLRALYREWKGQHIGRAVRHYSAAAYAVGADEGVPRGEARRWLVDPTCVACPDCDDNALAGEIGRGELFPTGHVRPPAHQDCRCLVVRVSRLR